MELIERGGWYHVARGINEVGTRIPRHTTKCRTTKAGLKAANKYLETVENTKVWPLAKEVKPEAAITFTEALEKYLRFKRPVQKEGTREQAEYDIRKYTIEALAARKPAITAVDQLTIDALVDLQNDWLDSYEWNSYAVHRRNSTAFCRYLFEENHLGHLKLTTHPWKRVLWAPKPDEVGTLPLDQDKTTTNWDRIREAIVPFLATLNRPSNPLWRYPLAFLALLELMYHTGLRRSDAVQFDPRGMEPSDFGYSYTTRQTKTDKPVTVFIEPWLAEKLRVLPVLKTGLPFYAGTCENLNNYIDWYVAEPLFLLGKHLGFPEEESLRCHRFRDSFATNFLNAGGSLEDLSHLLGHEKVATTETYYCPKVKSRAQAIEQRLMRLRSQQSTGPKLTVVPAA